MARQASAPLTIKTACERWWSEHGQHLGDPRIEARLSWLVDKIGANTPLHEISDDMVARLVQLRRCDRIRAGRDQDGKQLYRQITERTINTTVPSLLRRVMRRARDNWNATIQREPVWRKHFLKETRRPVREISAAEETRLDAVEGHDFALVRKFAVITGLRRKNLILTWPQVDFDLAVIRVVTKGGQPRTIPLTREAYAILWSRRGHHPEFVFTFVAERSRPCPKTGRKFVRGQRYPITAYGLQSHWERVRSKIGADDLRIHDFRHTCGMRTMRAVGNLRLVQGILGHSDIAITAKFYTDATIADMRQAMETTQAAQPQQPPALPHLKTAKDDKL
jgi:integrase